MYLYDDARTVQNGSRGAPYGYAGAGRSSWCRPHDGAALRDGAGQGQPRHPDPPQAGPRASRRRVPSRRWRASARSAASCSSYVGGVTADSSPAEPGQWLTQAELASRSGRGIAAVRSWVRRRREQGLIRTQRNNRGETQVWTTPALLAELGQA